MPMNSMDFALEMGQDPFGRPVEGQDLTELQAACARLDAQPDSEFRRLAKKEADEERRLVGNRT